jgi:hypothetical protein
MIAETPEGLLFVYVKQPIPLIGFMQTKSDKAKRLK